MSLNPMAPPIALCLWLAIIAIACLWPAVSMLASIAMHLDHLASPPVRWGLLGRTLAYASGIGVLATLLSLPIAWGTRGLRSWWSPVVALPLMLPMPLAYAGLNLIRAPGTPVGDWLALGPSWRAIAAGRAIAVLGLAFWATPIAAFVLSAGIRQIDRETIDSASLDARSPLRRLGFAISMTRGTLLAAAAAVAMVMTGSAIPLHLAQVNTYAISLWLSLDATPAGETWRIWFESLPLLAIAAGAGAVIAITVVRSLRRDQQAVSPPRAGRATRSGAIAVLLCASLVPLLLLARELTTLETFRVLWRTESGALTDSATVAMVVGAACALVCWLTRLVARGPSLLLAIGLLATVTLALAPGVLVGSVIAGAWSGVPLISESLAIVVLAHLARFLAVPALLGVLLAAAEPRDDRDQRLLDGASGIAGSLRAAGPGSVLTAIGVGLVCAAMSLGEIESGVIVQPPGAQSAARSMLNMLHFARYEHLSGLVLMVAVPAALLGGVAWSLLVFGRTLHPRRAFR